MGQTETGTGIRKGTWTKIWTETGTGTGTGTGIGNGIEILSVDTEGKYQHILTVTAKLLYQVMVRTLKQYHNKQNIIILEFLLTTDSRTPIIK